jgi:hypothetical protein
VQDVLAIGSSRFFALLKAYGDDSEAFSVAYERNTSPRLSAEVTAAIESALLAERALASNPDMPISSHKQPLHGDERSPES